MSDGGIKATAITGVVAALRAEARCLGAAERRAGARAAHLLVRTSGIGRERAARSAEELLRAGAEALVSFGVGGALDPALRCGDAVLATEVLCDASTRLPSCPEWLRQLEATLRAAAPMGGAVALSAGAVLTCDEIVASVQRKRELFATSGALVVDMESAAVAAVAHRAGVPFLGLRVVADTAEDALPEVLQHLLAAGSGRAPDATFWWPLVRAPGSWPSLARLAARYRTARRVLLACAQAGLARQMGAAPEASGRLRHAAASPPS